MQLLASASTTLAPGKWYTNRRVSPGFTSGRRQHLILSVPSSLIVHFARPVSSHISSKFRMLSLFSRPFHFRSVLYRTSSRFRYPRIPPMSRRGNLDISPPVHRGMKDQLDRDSFKKSIAVLGVKITPEKVHTTLRSEKIRRCVTGC